LAKKKQEELVESVHQTTEEAKEKTKLVEAAHRKQQELVAAVHEKTEEAKQKTKEVEAAKLDADDKKRQAEESAQEAEKRFQEAIDFLEAEKKKPGATLGTFWYMDRELQEKKKYLPKSKQ